MGLESKFPSKADFRAHIQPLFCVTCWRSPVFLVSIGDSSTTVAFGELL